MSRTVYWHFQDYRDIPASDSWLSDKEKSIQQKFIYDKRKNEWRLGRWTLKNALHKQCGLPVNQIEILSLKNGAPKLVINQHKSSLAVSVSHRENRAVCAFSDHFKNIGCDLEYIEPRSDLFIKDYFTREEISLVKRNPHQIHLLTNLIWSAKESVSKCLQLGLTLDTRDINVHTIHLNGTNTWTDLQISLKNEMTYYGCWTVIDNFVITLATTARLDPIRID